FYRDIRDWVGTSKPIDTYRGITYYKYENKDYASAKGVTLSGRANINNFNVNCDYTYMIVEGTSSDPKDAYNDAQNNRAPRLTMINLNWDQRHSFNAILNYWNKGWNATLIGNVASGFPYTPSFARGEVSGSGTFVGLRENSEFKPLTTNLDFRLSKKFKVGKLNLTMFFTALNFLDIRNVRYVYSDTGQADYTLDGINQQDRPGDPDVEISEVDEYFTRPGYYSAPRFLQIGFRISN
ncbi:MAG: hypothetical protein KAR38_03380, partial [Calditrichia bacterium]|nr:hypothetical protein [Calditrichia bacterium]